MNMRSILIFITILLLLSSFVIAQEGVCAGMRVCEVAANSLYGYGMVEFCGKCYPCGVSDGVCPEDFAQDGLVGSCRNCPDPDCIVNISGRVYVDGFEQGDGVSGLDIFAYHSAAPYTGNLEATSGNNGIYTAEVPSGKITLSVKDNVWSSDSVQQVFKRGTNYQNIDIVVRENQCNSDCTTSFGLCSEACQNLNGCLYQDVDAGGIEYTAEYLAEQCNNRPLNNEFELESNDDLIWYYRCCDGGVYSEEPITPPESGFGVTGNNDIKNLRSTTIPVKINGEIHYLVINVWNDK